jgi:hypothetical protein
MTLTRPAIEDILPLLVSTYRRGHLVPFLGAGMSAKKLALWDDFVTNLEHEADISYDKSLKLSNDVRAQRACTKIRNSRGAASFLESIGRALTVKDAPQEIPLQTTRLAAINWPLVVSTNYDDLFLGACRCRLPGAGEQPQGEMDVQVLGRSPKDCKLVLSSLHGPFDRQYIWHVQGFLGGQFGGGIEKAVPGLDDLRDQLVVGHAEYRLVTNSSPHFRRCFGEMFNSRSFLFLGSSLTEGYFLNLFGEVLDLCGPSALPHFAFTKKGTVDAHFLADQMNITVCEFDCYEELPNYLQQLQNAIANPQARNTRWSFAVGSSPDAEDDLDIVRDDAPLKPGPHEVIALVARRDTDNRPMLQPPYEELNRQYRSLQSIGNHVLKYGDADIYAVTARCRGDEDDSAVDDAVRELLDEIDDRAKEHGEKRNSVHLQLSPTGTVPPVFAFMKVVRAFAAWKREKDKESQPRSLRLILHIQSDVEFNLTSGRIDVQELLSSELVRFWAVVSLDPKKEPVRRVLHYKEETKLEEVLVDLGVPFGDGRAEWSLSVCPSPRKAAEKGVNDTTSSLYKHTLLSIGVVFGSVLTLDFTGAANGLGKAAAGRSSENPFL